MYPITSAVKALFEAEQRQVLRITFNSARDFKNLSMYDDGNTRVYRLDNGQELSVFSGATEVFTSGNSQTIILYSGDNMVFQNSEEPVPVYVTITDAEVPHGAFSIDRYSCNGNKLEIGTAIASELRLKLNNYDKRYNGIRFEGVELFVEIGIADWSEDEPTITYIPCGYFTSDTQPRTLDTITISALDRMTRFDKEVDATALTFPMTVSSLVGAVCTLCNVPFSQAVSTLPNASFSIAALPETVQSMTYRNLIQWCAGIMGTNAWIDWSGSLRFSWYGEATGYTTTIENRFNSDLYEDDIAITGVQYTNTQGTTIVSGTADYALDMTGNYLAVSGIAEIMGNINTAINGFTYRPFSATVINAPYLWPMDGITFTDADDNDHATILTNVNFNMSSTVLKGNGETAQTNLGASPGALTNEQAFLVEKAKQAAIDDVDESLTQQDIFNRLTDNGQLQGLYMRNGELYVNGTYIRGGTLVLGGLNNVNGLLQILDASGNVVVQGNNDGLQISNGSISFPSSSGTVNINTESIPGSKSTV